MEAKFTSSLLKKLFHDSSFSFLLLTLAILIKIWCASSCLLLTMSHLGLSGIKLHLEILRKLNIRFNINLQIVRYKWYAWNNH